MSTSTPTRKRKLAVHQPFSWLSDDTKGHPVAEFIALTHDVSNGIESCLEIIEASHLDRVDLDPEDTELPAVDVCDASKMLRLAIVTSRQLRRHAAEMLDWIDNTAPDANRQRATLRLRRDAMRLCRLGCNPSSGPPDTCLRIWRQ